MKSRNSLPKKGTLFQFSLSYWWDIYSSDAMTEWEWILVNQITIVQAKVDCVILVFLSLAFRSETVNFSQQIRDVQFVNLQCCLAGSVWCQPQPIYMQIKKDSAKQPSTNPPLHPESLIEELSCIYIIHSLQLSDCRETVPVKKIPWESFLWPKILDDHSEVFKALKTNLSLQPSTLYQWANCLLHLFGKINKSNMAL